MLSSRIAAALLGAGALLSTALIAAPANAAPIGAGSAPAVSSEAGGLVQHRRLAPPGPDHAAIVAAGDDPVARGMDAGRKDRAVMDISPLATLEPHRAIAERKDGKCPIRA